MLKYVTLVGLVLSTAVAWSADRPHPADVYRKDGRDLKGFYVIKHTFGEVLVSNDDRATVKTTVKAADLLRIDYEEIRGMDLARAQGLLKKKRYDDALESLEGMRRQTEYADTVYHKTKVAILRAKGDVAAIGPVVDAFIDVYPDHPAQLELLFAKAEANLKAGETAAAESGFQTLMKKAGLAGIDNEALGAANKGLATYGLMQVAEKKGDNAQLKKLGREALGMLDASAAPEAFADVVGKLITALKKENDTDGVVKLYRSIAYQPVGGALQSEAHLNIAQAEQAAGNSVKAFDHAVIAFFMPGSTKRSGARKLAQEAEKVLAADANISDDDKREYKQYLLKLR